MTRTFALLVPALMLMSCAAAPSRPAAVSGPQQPPDTVVRVPGQRFRLQLPHGWWHLSEDGDDQATTLVHERRGVTITVTSRRIEDDGFVATTDAVRREAFDAGCTLRRGYATYVTDQFGRRAVMAARRTVGDEVQDGEIAVLELEGREGALVIQAWWRESPSTWMVEDVHHIVDSVRAL